MDNVSSSMVASSSELTDASFYKMLKTKSRIYDRRLCLAKAVQKRKNVLFGHGFVDVDESGNPGCSNSQRHDAWEAVRQEVLRKGFSEFASKSRLDIQKTDWQHVRRYVMDKRKKESSSKDDPITELDTIVFDIVQTAGRISTNSTKGSVDNNVEDNEMLDESVQLNSYVNGSRSASPEYKSEENGVDHLPQFSQLLNFQFQPPQLSSQPENTNNTKSRIVEIRLQREEYLTMQEKIKTDIENERLIQEKIKTQLLLAQLLKENPQAVQQFSDN